MMTKLAIFFQNEFKIFLMKSLSNNTATPVLQNKGNAKVSWDTDKLLDIQVSHSNIAIKQAHFHTDYM